ncbi:hypothetical protein CBL_00801 [Carabus blaptoides fortunei]
MVGLCQRRECPLSRIGLAKCLCLRSALCSYDAGGACPHTRLPTNANPFELFTIARGYTLDACQGRRKEPFDPNVTINQGSGVYKVTEKMPGDVESTKDNWICVKRYPYNRNATSTVIPEDMPGQKHIKNIIHGQVLCGEKCKPHLSCMQCRNKLTSALLNLAKILAHKHAQTRKSVEVFPGMKGNSAYVQPVILALFVQEEKWLSAITKEEA